MSDAMDLLQRLGQEADARPVNAGWFEEPKDNDPASEFDRQRSVLAELRKSAPAVIAFAVPNGVPGTDWTKLRKHREGAVKGACDLVIVWNHGILFAEMKGGRTRIEVAQIEFLNRLHHAGFRCGVYRKPATLIAHLREAGAPFLWRERMA